ncbi:hypothetical protein GCM10007160_04660 [Litchfieldella qijiaojingensis]|uniref:O-antigen ligase-related domain-containing protein n=1 Tax=Litchfieldella qijiaojingensis TaxID=980347 RepID=A0ABQ2YE77_9GAMM|nr:O-antigen ligase family protein [Halomonas qijiaojingensis]GGX80229.1 hypothetical protein GCM10007160_04660 [Halomonas qijiaojingensis]
MSLSTVWQRVNTWLLFAFAALLIVVPWGYAVIPLVAAGVVLAGWLCGSGVGDRLRRLDAEDGWWCLALLGYGGLWLWDVWRTGHWPVGEGSQGVALPLWPILAALLLVWLRCFRPSPYLWWLGIGCGALAAGGIALFERLVLGVHRASNDMNAIPFGNLSLLLGVISLMAALWLSSRSLAGRWGWLRLAFVAALAGILASLLSGTRGGWVAAPLLLLLVWRGYRDVVNAALLWRWRWALSSAVLLLAFVVVLPQSGVSHRVAEAFSDVHDYWSEENRSTSIGLRFEMWRGGWQLFLQRPLAGWGEGGVQEARDALVAKGILHPDVSQYDQLHSDIIDTAARRGILGLATLAMLYGVPLVLFARRLSQASAGERALAVAGLMIPIAFIDFGLTQSMLRDVRGLSGYLGLCIGCWAVLKREGEKYLAAHTDKTLTIRPRRL